MYLSFLFVVLCCKIHKSSQSNGPKRFKDLKSNIWPQANDFWSICLNYHRSCCDEHKLLRFRDVMFHIKTSLLAVKHRMSAFILSSGGLTPSSLGLGSLIDLARSMDPVRMFLMGRAGGQVVQGLGGVGGGVDQDPGWDRRSPPGKI